MADFLVRFMDLLLYIVNIMSEDIVWLKGYFQTSKTSEICRLFLAILVWVILFHLSIFLLRLFLKIFHLILKLLINKSDGKKCLNFLLKKSEIILRSFLHSRYSYCKGYDAGYAKAMEQNRPAQPKSLWDDICGVTVSMFSSLFNFKR